MTYSLAKLTQIAIDCGSTVSPITLGQLLADPRQTTASIAAALFTTPAKLATALITSPAKLAQVVAECGSTVSAVFLDQLLADPRQTTESIAGIMGTTPAWFARALAKPEPTVYAPMTTSNV